MKRNADVQHNKKGGLTMTMSEQEFEDVQEIQRLMDEVNRLKEENASLKTALNKKTKVEESLTALPMIVGGREHRVYLAQDVDKIIQRKNELIEHLDRRLHVYDIATRRTRSG